MGALTYFDGNEAWAIERRRDPIFVALFGTGAAPSWEAEKLLPLRFLDDTTKVRIARRVFANRWADMLTESDDYSAKAAMEGMVRDAVRRFTEAAGALPPLPTPAQPNDYSFMASRVTKVVSKKRRKEFKEAVSTRFFGMARLRELNAAARGTEVWGPWDEDELRLLNEGLATLLEIQREHWRSVY